MGGVVSVDSSPINIEDLVKKQEDEFEKELNNSFSSNIKVWSFEPKHDSAVESIIKSIDFTKDFQYFNPKHCYLVLHLFHTEKKHSSTITNTKAKLSSHSLFQLAISASQHLSSRGLEHSFSVNELQTSFFSKSITNNLFTIRSNSLEGGYLWYDIYLWHGKESNPCIQAEAIAKCYDIERILLMDESIVTDLFSRGSPVPLCEHYVNDIPLIGGKENEISRISSSQAVLYMSLYQQCHLFRSLLINNLDGLYDSDVVFRTLLQAPPSEQALNVSTQSKYQSDDDSDTEYMASPAASPRGGDEEIVKRGGQSPNLLNISGIIDEHDNISSPRISSRVKGNKRKSSLSPLPLDVVENVESSSTPRESSIVVSDRKISAGDMAIMYRKVCSKITDHIFIGSDLVARDKVLLLQNGITSIINAAKVVCDNYFTADFTYMALSLYDSGEESVLAIFYRVIDFIEKEIEKGGNVLIHCYEGFSRSTTLAISYIMWKSRRDFNTVLEEVKLKRPVTSPNQGFITQLVQWEKILGIGSSEPFTPSWLFRIAPQNDLYTNHRELVPKLCKGRTLDARTCFILQDKEKLFIWIGNKITNEEIITQGKAFTQLLKIYSNVPITAIEIAEDGAETLEFWDSLVTLKDVPEKYNDLDLLDYQFKLEKYSIQNNELNKEQ
ncbi:hypothetical protein ABK040_015656 [Willaertia magna]